MAKTAGVDARLESYARNRTASTRAGTHSMSAVMLRTSPAISSMTPRGPDEHAQPAQPKAARTWTPRPGSRLRWARRECVA